MGVMINKTMFNDLDSKAKEPLFRKKNSKDQRNSRTSFSNFNGSFDLLRGKDIKTSPKVLVVISTLDLVHPSNSK